MILFPLDQSLNANHDSKLTRFLQLLNLFTISRLNLLLATMMKRLRPFKYLKCAAQNKRFAAAYGVKRVNGLSIVTPESFSVPAQRTEGQLSHFIIVDQNLIH